MRILFVVDGRSQIALNWISYFVDQGHEVHLASTFTCQPGLKLASLVVVPVALSGLKPTQKGGNARTDRGGVWRASLLPLRTLVRQWVGPLTVLSAANRLAEQINRLQPDLVHAMRIPYEGMLAARAVTQLDTHRPPLLVSVWGNDFTLHAPSTPLMKRFTRFTMLTADALHTDCRRDLNLAVDWGYDPGRPSTVLPGAGGFQADIFYPSEVLDGPDNPIVVNPRGFRSYVRNDTFFKAVPLILAKRPDVHFICPTMAGDPQAERWLDEYNIRHAVELLPSIPRSEMADLFRRAWIAVSPSTHDGTPNTLLEAMACGCFPVAGDLESIREWITHTENGFLVDPANPQALAEAVLSAIADGQLRRRARQVNLALVAEKASYNQVMQHASAFYEELCKKIVP